MSVFIFSNLRFFLIIFILYIFTSYSFTTQVSDIRVYVDIKNTTICDEIKDRIKVSIEKTATKILINKEIEKVREQKEEIEDTLYTIFNKVLIGFTVDKFMIEEGKVTKIFAYLIANEPLINAINISIDYGSIHRIWQELLDTKKDKIKQEIRNYIIGLPKTSEEWTSSIIIPPIRQKIENLNIFVDFLLEVYIDFQKEMLYIKLYPKGEIIRKAELRFYSDTLPTLYLKLLNYYLSKQADTIISLPVGFLNHYKDYLIEEFDNVLLKEGIRDKMHLDINTTVDIDKLTIIRFHIDSTKYRSKIYGLIDIGKEEEYSSSLNTIFTTKIYHNYEFITRINIIPSPFEIDTKIGIGKFIAQDLYTAFMRELTKDKYFLYVIYDDKLLRMEFLPNLEDMIEENEISWGYYLKKFLRFELVRKKPDEYLLRMVIEF